MHPTATATTALMSSTLANLEGNRYTQLTFYVCHGVKPSLIERRAQHACQESNTGDCDARAFGDAAQPAQRGAALHLFRGDDPAVVCVWGASLLVHASRQHAQATTGVLAVAAVELTADEARMTRGSGQVDESATPARARCCSKPRARTVLMKKASVLEI